VGKKFTIQDASGAELDDLAPWYALAAAYCGDGFGEELGDARRSGLLGAAMRGGGEHAQATIGRYRTMFDSLCARTVVLSARVRGRTAGMIVIGPNPVMLRQGPQYNGFNIAVLLNVAKLHMVAVDPEYQKAGIGSRLIEVGTQIARQSGYQGLYGEFDSTRTHLAAFYQRLGFAVLDRGELLDLTAMMGTQTLVTTAEPTDQFGVMALT